MDEQKDKIKDLEVKEGEAQDIAGGKKIQAKSRGAKSRGAMKVKSTSADGVRYQREQT